MRRPATIASMITITASNERSSKSWEAVLVERKMETPGEEDDCRQRLLARFGGLGGVVAQGLVHLARPPQHRHRLAPPVLFMDASPRLGAGAHGR